MASYESRHFPIEHVRDMIGILVRQRQRPPTTLAELGQALQEERNRRPRIAIGRIIRNIPRQLTNRDGITHY